MVKSQIKPAKAGFAESSLLRKVLTATEDTQWDKSEIRDARHWLKQAVSLGAGAFCGVVPILNGTAFLFFAAVLLLTCILFYRSYLKWVGLMT